MVLACERKFSRTSFDARPQNLYTFSKVNLKYIQGTFPVGQVRYNFHLPFSYDLQILLARGNGASTNVEPCIKNISRLFLAIWPPAFATNTYISAMNLHQCSAADLNP